MRHRAPGVVAANAQLALRAAHYGFGAGRQLVGMARVFNFVRGVGQGAEQKPLARKPHPASGIVSNGRGAHADARAALLRRKIGLQRRARIEAEQPHARALGKIGVALARAGPIIHHAVAGLRQRQHQAEFGHTFHGLVLPLQRGLYPAVSRNGIGDIHLRTVCQSVFCAQRGARTVRFGLYAAQRGVKARRFKRQVRSLHPRGAVVVRGRAPEVQRDGPAQQLFAAPAVRDDAALLCPIEQQAEIPAVHADVHQPLHQRYRQPARRLLRPDAGKMLSLSHTKALLRPWRILAQLKKRIHCIFARCFRYGERQRHARRFARRGLHGAFLALQHNAVSAKAQLQRIGRGIGEQQSVFYGNARFIGQKLKALIAGLCLGQLRRGRAVGKQQAVAHELVIRRAVAEIAAVGKIRLAQIVRAGDALIDPIPDKAALILRNRIRHARVALQRAERGTHRMRVFAQDEGLFGVRGDEALHLGRRGIHLAFYIAGIGIAPVVEDPLVMHQARGILFAQKAAHLVDVFSAKALVAAAPQQDAGVVFVAFEHAVCAVQHRRAPFGPIPRQSLVRPAALPAAVRFQVRFVDDIQPVCIAQIIPLGAVGIVAGAHGVDVTALHKLHIVFHLLARYAAPCAAAPFMAVYAPEHNALSVQQHQPVLQFKPAKARLAAHRFQRTANGIAERNGIRVQRGILGAPQMRVRNGQVQRGAAVHNGRAHHKPVCAQRYIARAGALHAHLHAQIAVGKILRQLRLCPNIGQMRGGLRKQRHAAKNAGHPPEILILQPAGRGKAIHAHSQPVFARAAHGRRKIEFRRRKAVFAVADEYTVAPYGQRRLHAVEPNAHRLRAPCLRHGKHAHIAAHGVVAAGDLGRR